VLVKVEEAVKRLEVKKKHSIEHWRSNEEQFGDVREHPGHAELI